MTSQPILKSPRLVLRAFTLKDAASVQLMAGHEKVAATTAQIPHPYPDGAAEEWISTHEPHWEAKKGVSYAITEIDGGALTGAIALMQWTGDQAEVGYWIGVDHWGQGYATEACLRLKEFALEELGINRLYAHHLAENPASGKVLEKAGFTYSDKGVAPENTRHAGRAIEQYEALRILQPGYTSAGLLETHRRLHQNLRDLLLHCRDFSAEEWNREIEGFGYGTLRLQLHHSLGAMRYWMGVLQGRIDAEDDLDDYPDVESLENWRMELEESVAHYLGEISATELNCAQQFMTWGGRKRALIPATVYLRTVMHQYQHQGQITAMCRLLGRPVNGLDFPLWGA